MKVLSGVASMLLGAGGADFTDFTDKFKELIDSFKGPIIAILIASAVLWGAFIGFKFMSSGGDDGKKKSAKSALIMFFVGLLVIFVVAAAVPIIISALQTWAF